MADIIQLNQEEIKSQLGDLVRQSVEDTLNAIMLMVLLLHIGYRPDFRDG